MGPFTLNVSSPLDTTDTHPHNWSGAFLSRKASHTLWFPTPAVKLAQPDFPKRSCNARTSTHIPLTLPGGLRHNCGASTMWTCKPCLEGRELKGVGGLQRRAASQLHIPFPLCKKPALRKIKTVLYSCGLW